MLYKKNIHNKVRNSIFSNFVFIYGNTTKIRREVQDMVGAGGWLQPTWRQERTFAKTRWQAAALGAYGWLGATYEGVERYVAAQGADWGAAHEGAGR